MKEAVVFGAGNIGRGFLGQLLCESGYHVTFVDIDQPLLDALNQRGEYTLRLVTNEDAQRVVVGPVRGVHADDLGEITRAICRAEIGMTAVGAKALPHIAGTIAQGIARRCREGIQAPFNIIVCENLHNAAAILREMVEKRLPPDMLGYMAQHVGFVDTVIARMVPPLTPALRAEDISQVIVEPYKELPVDRDGFVGPLPQIVGLIPHTPFEFYTERKLYIHNAGHAVLSYLGYLAGYEYGYQALADDEIYFQVRGAMEESALALTRKFRPPAGSLLANIEDLLRRFGNRALGDTILRLGRDPIRKLGRDDRLVGAALDALSQEVTPVHLVTGIAAALCFDHPEDPIAADLQTRLRRDGIERVLIDVCGLSRGETLFEMIVRRYRALRQAGET